MSQQHEPKAEARLRQHLELDKLVRRRLWFSLRLPVLALLAVVVPIVGTVLSLRSPVQVAVMADSMLTVLVLCPLALCMFPLVILCLALVSLMGRWHPQSRSPLRRLEAWTAAVEGKVEAVLGNVDTRVLNWAVRLAPLRQLLRTFETPNDELQNEEET